jgi:hypothetical protein
MATSSTSTTVPANERNQGTFEYPEHLPDSPALQATYLYRMVRETLELSQRTQEAVYDFDQRIGNLERQGEEINGRLVAIRSLQENQQIGLQEIHKTLLPNHPDHKGKAKAEPTPGPSTSTNPKKEEPSRATRRSSFVFSLDSNPSSREPSPVRKGFSFRASTIPPAAASTPIPAAMSQVPKLSSPDSYDGKKRGRPARQWLARVLAWVELSRAAFPNEQALILYMLHLLKDDAANWAQPHLQKVLNHRRGAIATVDKFIEEFGAAFDDPDAGRATE